MRNASIVLLPLLALCVPASASQSTSSDVVVMRRVVSKPTMDPRKSPPYVWMKVGSEQTPESCGMVSVADVYECRGMNGDGLQVDPSMCKSARPSTSTQVEDRRACDDSGRNRFYERRLSSLKLRVAHYPGGFYYLSGSYNGSSVLQDGKFILNVAADSCVDSRSGAALDPALCTGVPDPAGAGDVGVPAIVNRNTRTVVLDQAAVAAAAGTLPGVDAVCSSTASFLVDGGDWKVRCDPSAIQDVYYWIATTAAVTTKQERNPDGQFSTAKPGDASVSYSVDGLVCMDSRTDARAANQTACSFYARPANAKAYAVPVKSWNQNRHRAVLDFRALAAAAPTVGNLEALCARSALPLYVNTQSAASTAWTVVCDPADVDDNYRKEATSVALPAVIYPAGTGNGAYNYLYAPSAGGSLTLSLSGTRCVDARTSGTASDANACTFYPSPTLFGDVSFPVKAASSKSRVAVVDSARMSAPTSPSVGNKSTFCAGTTFRTYYNGDGWRLRCDDISLLDDAYHVDSTTISHPTQQNSCPRYTDGSGYVTCNIGTIPAQGANWPAVFSGKACYADGTNAPVSVSKCQYIDPNPTGTYGMRITKRSEKTRILVVDTTAARAAAPQVSFTSFCSASVVVNYGISWQVKCDGYVVDEDFFNRVSTLSFMPSDSCPRYSDGSGYTSCNYNYALPAVGSSLSLRVTGNQCYNAAGTILASSRCQYLPTPSDVALSARIVAKDNASKVITLDVAPLKASYPWVADAVCDKPFTARLGEAWTARCS